MENFTPVSALAGGILIGLAATLMLFANGRITGISGILGGILFPQKTDVLWRLVFIGGLLTGAVLYTFVASEKIVFTPQSNTVMTLIGGLLVGFGTRMGSGCTSGHGICGIARMSGRSFAATSVFILTAFITVYVSRHLLGLIP